MDGIELPATWQFLGGGWWILHLISISLVFLMGYAIGRSSNSAGSAIEIDNGDSASTAPAPGQKPAPQAKEQW